MTYAERLRAEGVKYAAFENYVTYQERVSPFLDTVAEVAAWITDNNVKYDNIRPVRNWREL